MGIRALIHVCNHHHEIMCLYASNNGEPAKLGAAIARLLQRYKGGGLGYLAVQIAAQLGMQFTLTAVRPGTEDVGEEYTYSIRGGMDTSTFRELPITIVCNAFGAPEFTGPVPAFAEFCQ